MAAGLKGVRAFRLWSILGALAAALLVPVALPGVELAAYDRRLALVGSLPAMDNRIQVIGIDDASLNALGQWPWPRATHAKLIEVLGGRGVQAVGLDLLFLRPSALGPGDDAALARALAALPPVILAAKVGSDALEQPVIIPPIPELARSAGGVGFANALPDADGKYRTVPLAVSIAGKMIPSFDLLMAARAVGMDPAAIQYHPRRILLGRVSIPVDDRWNMQVNYPGDFFAAGAPGEGGAPRPVFAARSYAEVLQPGGSFRLKDRLVDVGMTATGNEDTKATPYGAKPGVFIHAAALNTILLGRFITKAPPWQNLGVTLLVALILGLALPRLGAAAGAAVTAGVLGGYGALNLWAFHNGWWLDLTGPLAAGALVFTGVEVAQFLRTRVLFGQFVAGEVVDRMLASDAASALGGVEQEVTILFSDIRGYTTLSETMSPSQVMEMLNQHHARMVAIIHEHDGRVFDYQGDAQAAVFGAPVPRRDHALAAVRAALGMQAALEDLRRQWTLEGTAAIEMGVGLCTGVSAVGIVGSADRKQFTVIGDTVNVASRLQGLSKELNSPVLAAPSTYAQVGDAVEADSLPPVTLKGKAEPMAPYRIRGLRQGTPAPGQK